MTSSSSPSFKATGPTADREALQNLQPFGQDICASWHEGEGGEGVPMHESALEELKKLGQHGRVILLSAPRAGHGKTHLLGRVAAKLQGGAVVAGLPWQTKEGLTWAGCGRGVLADLAHPGATPNALQHVCSGVHAALLRRLIQTGRIPSTDPTQALRVLAQDPMNLFSDSGPAKVIGEWFRKHYDQLLPALAEVSYVEGRAEVEGWLKGMFEYVEHPVPGSLLALTSRMNEVESTQISRFLRLAALWKPVILVADHMDGLYRDAEAGVAAARMSLALASLPGVHMVLSMNQDLWETTFGRQLPSALEDRLNSRSVSLAGITAEESRALLALRLENAGVGAAHQQDFLRFLDIERYFLGRGPGSVSTRGLLRHASLAWRQWLGTRPAEHSIVPPAPLRSRPSEDFLPAMSEAAAPLLPDDDDEDAADEDLSKLANKLAQEEGGQSVSLAGMPPSFSSGAAAPRPFLPTRPLPPSLPPSGLPSTGLPPTGLPPAGLPSAGLPSTGLPSTGLPSTGLPSTGLPSTGLPPSLPTRPAPNGAPAEADPPTSFQSSPAPVDMPDHNFARLRQLLSKVRASAETASLPEAPPKPPVWGRPAGMEQAPVERAAGFGSSTPLPGNGTLRTLLSPQPITGSDLLERFKELRRQIVSRDHALKIDWSNVGGILRTAGKRFPVVNFDEVEVPGLVGRSVPRWRLQGVEMVFGLDDFSDEKYWSTVTSFVMGRVAENSARGMQSGQPSAQLKLVIIKGDTEASALAGLLQKEVIPIALRPHLDVVHLDNQSIGGLYAMHQLMTESESGALNADMNLVLSSLAGELDFFWKRLARPITQGAEA